MQSKVFGSGDSKVDTEIFDTTTDATYNFQGWARRQDVLAAGSLAAAQALPIWMARRTTKVSPHVTDSASNQYNQTWDDVVAGTVTSWEAV